MLSALAFVMLLQAGPADWARSASRAEEAGRYAEAVSWYARIRSEAPASYVSRRAATRLKELEAHADYGFVPYGRFQALLQGYAALGSEKAVDEANRIIAEFPGAAIVPEVVFWLGNEYREVRRQPEGAAAIYRDLARRFPDHPLAPKALEQVARIYESAKQFDRAAAAYAEIEARYPQSAAPEAFEKRKVRLAQHRFRKAAVRFSWGALGTGLLTFLLVGGWRVRRDDFLRHAKGKAGLAFLLGIPPAAFLWVYDGMWSPSLTTLSVAFATYGAVLAALASRVRVPPQPWVAVAERAVFGVFSPLAILALVVNHFQLWEAFGL